MEYIHFLVLMLTVLNLIQVYLSFCERKKIEKRTKRDQERLKRILNQELPDYQSGQIVKIIDNGINYDALSDGSFGEGYIDDNSIWKKCVDCGRFKLFFSPLKEINQCYQPKKNINGGFKMSDKKIGEKVWAIVPTSSLPIKIKIDLIKITKSIEEKKSKTHILFISYDGCADFDSISVSGENTFDNLSDYVDKLKKEFPNKEDWEKNISEGFKMSDKKIGESEVKK